MGDNKIMKLNDKKQYVLSAFNIKRVLPHQKIIFKDKAKAISVCVNRFDDETKQSFLELYDKVDADFEFDKVEEDV